MQTQSGTLGGMHTALIRGLEVAQSASSGDPFGLDDLLDKLLVRGGDMDSGSESGYGSDSDGERGRERERTRGTDGPESWDLVEQQQWDAPLGLTEAQWLHHTLAAVTTMSMYTHLLSMHYTHIYIHTHIQSYAHSYTYTNIYIHTHTHTGTVMATTMQQLQDERRVVASLRSKQAMLTVQVSVRV